VTVTKRDWNDAHAVVSGACNVSGVAYSLKDILPRLEEATSKVDKGVRYDLNRLIQVCEEGWPVDRDKARPALSRMAVKAFTPGDGPAQHSIFRMFIDQMAQLVGDRDRREQPEYNSLWMQAYEEVQANAS